ncbi:MAG TPA: hypothetical protein VFN92_06465 [Solirubrobacterales bacterium]|nr:hypothetical protein [Solirubrobacterales bacterium]
MDGSEYIDWAEAVEEPLSPLAKRSFDSANGSFIDGTDLLGHFQEKWKTDRGRASIENRTPHQLERDRVLYSPGLRKQAEKYHVLYNRERRIVRSYATHTMRCAQVTRAIARGLDLNEDFAEAIALGSKVGATPFVHAAKEPTDKWLQDTIEEIDNACANGNDTRSNGKLFEAAGGKQPPLWIQRLSSASTFEAVTTLMPWAAGEDTETAYSSGQQSYWSLCWNPLAIQPKAAQFQPETMFGIWRHSRKLRANGTVFAHSIQPPQHEGTLEIDGSMHATFEALVVQYADDITWAIENLDDAHTAAMLNGRDETLYDLLEQEMGIGDLPDVLGSALHEKHSGGLYTYFIREFISHSGEMLKSLATEAKGPEARKLLGECDERADIGLPPTAEQALDRIIAFLNRVVFEEPRVSNRKDLLAEVSRQCLRLLYQEGGETLGRIQKERARLERWSLEAKDQAKELLDRDVYRAQAAVTVFAGMADQEIYDFVGIQAL